LGRRLELSDIALESLFTKAVDDDNPTRFVEKLAALDDEFAERVARAKSEGKVLRYVAKIAPRSIRVGVEAVEVASPLGRLRGTDNTIVIHSKRYSANPLVVTGPGAGAAVTAAGVLNDIVAITMHERRKVMR
jgi:aspartokinase/homoserine dehydrogenase 1